MAHESNGVSHSHSLALLCDHVSVNSFGVESIWQQQLMQLLLQNSAVQQILLVRQAPIHLCAACCTNIPSPLPAMPQFLHQLSLQLPCSCLVPAGPYLGRMCNLVGLKILV